MKKIILTIVPFLIAGMAFAQKPNLITVDSVISNQFNHCYYSGNTFLGCDTVSKSKIISEFISARVDSAIKKKQSSRDSLNIINSNNNVAIKRRIAGQLGVTLPH